MKLLPSQITNGKLSAGLAMAAIALAAVLATTTGTSGEGNFREALDIERDAPDRTGPLGGFSEVVDRVSPSVVSIYTEKRVRARQFQPPSSFFDDPFFRRFFGDRFEFYPFPEPDENDRPSATPEQFQKQTALGSGVVLTKDGYIITNNHVIDGADEVKVRFPANRKDYEAEVVGRDPSTDVAVLRVDARNLSAATLGDSATLKVGDLVLAIGNPFGLSETVTTGIVSGLGRKNLNIASYENFIQTDASINPGNSGGALVDNRGRVVGINTAIVPRAGGGGNIGIGFAIPINMALDVAERLIEDGEIRRGYLGVMLSDLNEDLAAAFNTRQQGALINEVIEDSPAQRAGFQPGDILIRYDGKPVDDMAHARLLVAGTEPGTEVKAVVLRDGEETELTITLGHLADNQDPHFRAGSTQGPFIDGVSIATLDDEHRRKFGIGSDKQGAVVTRVDSSSAAAEAGLEPGHVIVEVDRKPVRSAAEAVSALKDAGDPDLLLLRVITDRGLRYLAVNMKPRN